MERQATVMKKLVALVFFWIFLLIGGAFSTLAEEAEHQGVQRSKLLDAAFTLLEKDNIFLTRYNEITGADIEPVFEKGLPYFFGGKDARMAFRDVPEYATRNCWETTRFYRKDQKYLFGFDCSGFTNWLFAQNGWKEHASLSKLVNEWGKYGKQHIFSHREGKQPPAYGELKPYLQVGDLLVTKHRSRHVMMYIGTLSDYGYTAEQVPELADYLDYPLVVHCGPHPDAGERFQQVIDANLDKYGRCKTTDGCVNVSIIGVPLDAAPNSATVQVNDFYWFELENDYKLTIWDYDNASTFIWYRHVL